MTSGKSSSFATDNCFSFPIRNCTCTQHNIVCTLDCSTNGDWIIEISIRCTFRIVLRWWYIYIYINGSFISSVFYSIKLIYFTGITGDVNIDDNGDRIADYSLLDMNPDTLKFEVSFGTESIQLGLNLLSGVHITLDMINWRLQLTVRCQLSLKHVMKLICVTFRILFTFN